MNLTVNGPINTVSFGQTFVSLLREFYKKKLQINLFQIGQSDLSAQTQDDLFNKLVQDSINSAPLNHNKNIPVFKLWHIIPSFEGIKSKFNSLYTFHETNTLTPYEKNALNCQDLIFVSSEYSKQVFEQSGVKTKVVTCPLGFDSFNFKKTNKKYYNDNKIVWGLIGKCETRKNTLKIIKLWAQKYGNNRDHVLHLLIDNQFINGHFKDPDATRKLVLQALEGKQYFNINWLKSVRTNAEMNDIHNSIDIDLSGLSLTEGWGIPYFTSLCLGKQGVALNAHANQMFCNKENSILVEPDGMIPAEDGLFFVKGAAQNQGYWFNIKDSDIVDAMSLAESKAKTPNVAGESLKDTFTFENTANIILNNLIP